MRELATVSTYKLIADLQMKYAAVSCSAFAAAGLLGKIGPQYAGYLSFSSLRWLMAVFISSVGLVFVVPDDELFVLSSFATASSYDAITLKRDKFKASFV